MKRKNPLFFLCLLAIVPLLLLTAGCGRNGAQEGAEDGGYRDDVPAAQAAQAAIDELREAYWPDVDLSEELLADQFGITEEMYEEYFGQTPMISAQVDALLIVKAKEGQEEAVKGALESYREYNVNEALQYPMNVGKVQAARIAAFGRYVCFVQLGGDTSALEEADADEGAVQEAVIEYCQAENDRALAKIEEALTRG